MILRILLLLLVPSFLMISCKKERQKPFTGANAEVKIITLDPGHFHAALVQKEMYPQVDSTVYIYAPAGPDLELHQRRIDGFNTRTENPTGWRSIVYTGDDYLNQMIAERKGNVIVVAGNNRKKTNYIKTSVEAGFNVLSDKPMAIDRASFLMLKEAFELADKNKVLLYDIMTERHEITSQLQREIALLPEIFGVLEKGTPENPAVIKESVHHFFKYVAGSVLRRPAWYFDVNTQGEGIVDVTTHLVDLIQWVCFPNVILDYTKDVNVYNARRWSTNVSKEQFLTITGLSEVPQQLNHVMNADSMLEVFANGEMNYTLNGVHAKVAVIWDYAAPEGGGDTHFSVMRGSKSSLIIRQGKEEGFIPELFIEPNHDINVPQWQIETEQAFQSITNQFPGITIVQAGNGFKVEIPSKYRIGHEAHFAQVTRKYLQYLVDGKLPEWEIPNMLAKYYTTTKALELARENSK